MSVGPSIAYDEQTEAKKMGLLVSPPPHDPIELFYLSLVQSNDTKYVGRKRAPVKRRNPSHTQGKSPIRAIGHHTAFSLHVVLTPMADPHFRRKQQRQQVLSRRKGTNYAAATRLDFETPKKARGLHGLPKKAF